MKNNKNKILDSYIHAESSNKGLSYVQNYFRIN